MLKSFYEIIKQHALETPNKAALCYSNGEVSYEEFFKVCNRVASALKPQLQSKTTFVPIIFERSHYIPIAIHSLQFINKAYVPLDFEYPDERLKYLLANIESPIVITQSKFKERIQSLGNYTVLVIEELMAGIGEVSAPTITPKDPVYMIYTSGTTGQPKGVVNIREGLMNRIEWMQDEYQVNAERVFLLKTPYTFDVSVWELTLPFLTGATLVVGGPKIHIKINEVIKTVEKYKVTDIHFVPSVLQIFLEILGETPLDSLDKVYCSGEGLSTELTKKYFATKLKAELHNLYGPTECSIDVSNWQCSAQDHTRFAVTPIGKPIRNTHFYVVDKAGKLTQDGAKGELWIGGIGVARGYHGQPELTRLKFVDDPFDSSGGKVYKTGDLVLKNTRGEYEFFGRIDFQVKINGQRVELSEIENALMKMEGMKRVAVLYEDNTLCAFIEKSQHLNEDTVTMFLKKSLPAYMVPSKYYFVEDMPLSSSGKTDRKALKSLMDK